MAGSNKDSASAEDVSIDPWLTGTQYIRALANVGTFGQGYWLLDKFVENITHCETFLLIHFESSKIKLDYV